ncbi:MAG: hypothetical protein EHM36_00805 [Deltaproteobacteria bacterium]|nr:MAG: hypothetical protein EHM36_00805 [Deltaproteobacteria bacterium]
MATKTLAAIYLKQGHLREAYQILKVLSEKDPFDREIRAKLREVGERLGLSDPPELQEAPPVPHEEDRIRILKGWLANILKQRRR